jgi:hypothetical protein
MSKPKVTRASLDPVEVIALSGFPYRQQVIDAEHQQKRMELVSDLAAIYGAIETRYGLEAGSIINGLYYIEGNQLIARR